MKLERSNRSRWAGTALLAIATIHTLFGVLAGARVISDPQLQWLVGERAILFSIKPLMGNDPDLAAMMMFWFLFFGFALIPLGALMRYLEKQRELPRFVGFHLAVLGLGGGVFLPVSGLWLALIPAYNVLFGRSRD